MNGEFLTLHPVQPGLPGAVPVGLNVTAQRFYIYNCFHLHE